MVYDGLERYIHERNYGCRISDRYTYKNWKLLVLENELLRVSVLPEKGSDIWDCAIDRVAKVKDGRVAPA